MKKKAFFKGMLAVVLSLSMVFSSLLPAAASQNKFEQVDNSAIQSNLLNEKAKVSTTAAQNYDAEDVVRVSIVLKDDSVIDAGYSTDDILNNSKALKQITKIKDNQKKVEKEIEKAIKKDLDVKQNLAIVANIVSADVKFGDISKIESVKSVKKVVIENQYEPCKGTDADDPMMAITTTGMTGATAAWADGYNGSGARIAIIDTGLDIDHQSFDDDAFIYALAQDSQAEEDNSNTGILGSILKAVKKAVKSLISIIKDLIFGKDDAKEKAKQIKKLAKEYNLLGVDEIKKALPYLTAYEKSGQTLTADQLFISNKIPFGFNYVDNNLNVTHLYDVQGGHGSHVSGIATGNRYLKAENGFVDALNEVGVAGNAPDAQIIVMKVFGENGGAFDSDYMSAIEDAIILGCDSVNLSLGSSLEGTSTNSEYQEILDKLTTTDTLVVMSAGNNGAWAANSTYGDLYSDGVKFATAGTPGSYTNSLGVASVDNIGEFGRSFVVNGTKYVFWESLNDIETGEVYGNQPIASLFSGESGTFDYVFLQGFGEEADYEGLDVTGKVVFVSRGTTSFYEKANIAAEKGALALIVYNNQAGRINMALTGYLYDIPAVSTTQEAGAAVLAASKAEGSAYVGKITINASEGPVVTNNGNYIMSDFSSWGGLGNLAIKPEIAAPGGAIYSVYGSNFEQGVAQGGSDQYATMSGTSMAAPQVTGLSADLKRFVEINKVTVKGYTKRAVAQSLLMSTATPMTDADGNYYPVLQQGAGLANVNDAINADSIITMADNATASAKDGKVKVELGDDAAKKGKYTFSFTINNITKSNLTYKLSADVFTQAIDEDDYFLLTSTEALDAKVTFTVDKKKATSVTVKKNKSVKVDVTIELTKDAKALLDATRVNGTYVEAYVFAKATNGSSTHSIPVLGFYGNWTDPSMYDVGSYIEYAYGLEDRAPYLYDINSVYGNAFTVNFADGSGEYYFGGNLYASSNKYYPEYASLNNQNGDTIKSIYYSLIRNAAQSFLRITDAKTGEVYISEALGEQYGCYWNANYERYYNTSSKLNLNWAGTDANGKKLPEGTAVNIDLIAVPELYVEADGSVDFDKLGDGAYFSTSLTIDNTAPAMAALGDGDTGSLYIIGFDNLAIASCMLFADNGRTLLAQKAVNSKDIAGVLATDLEAGVYLVALVDYAGNMSTYKVFLGVEPTYEVESIEISADYLTLMKNNSTTLSAIVGPDTIADDTVIWTSSDESVAIVDQNGKVTAVGLGECFITATAAIDETKSADCYIEVIEINKELNGVVWDENGEVWFSQFNTTDLPNYTKLSGSVQAPINNVSYGPDGRLYASDIDTANLTSNLYTVDENFNLTLVGSSEIAYTSMDVAPGMGYILASYGPYILVVDPETGDYLGAFNYLSSNYVVGITYVGSQYNSNYGAYLDMYYILDDAGNFYFEAFITFGGSFYYFNGEDDALFMSSGIQTSEIYFQSIYFDGEYTYVSNFNEADNCVVLYAVDTEYTGDVFVMGQFADGVWPVGGLGEYAIFDTAATTDKAASLVDAVVKADVVMVNSINK